MILFFLKPQIHKISDDDVMLKETQAKAMCVFRSLFVNIGSILSVTWLFGRRVFVLNFVIYETDFWKLKINVMKTVFFVCWPTERALPDWLTCNSTSGNHHRHSFPAGWLWWWLWWWFCGDFMMVDSYLQTHFKLLEDKNI